MKHKVYNKNLSPSCEYCLYGNLSEFNDEIFCIKRGVTHRRDACSKYQYDPLKRIPQRQKIADGYKPEDFEL